MIQKIKMSEQRVKKSAYLFFLITAFMVFTNGCTLNRVKRDPSVRTTFKSVSLTQAIVDGDITDKGGSRITAKGICWSTSPNPTVEEDKTSGGTGAGSFTGTLTGLSVNTTYYACAYAINNTGVGYGQTVTFKTKGTVTDIDGNVYDVIAIGTQIWMKENLRTTRYHDGTKIPEVTSYDVWKKLTTAAYSWYDNDSLYANPYGAMYNYYVVSTNKLCPVGWHVPANDDWTQLTDFLGGVTVAGGKLKEAGITHWDSPNADATNESGFTAVPAGYRSCTYGVWFSMGQDATWWSSSRYDNSSAWCRAITLYNTSDVQAFPNDDGYGTSVRCIKDND